MDDLKDIRLLTPKEVAELLGVGAKTLRRLTKQGVIGHRRVGLKYKYTQRHVEDFIKGGASDQGGNPAAV